MFKSVPGSVKDAVKAIQVQINLIRPGTFLAIDGIIGPLTRGAYKALTGEQRSLVDKLADARNSSLKGELNNTAAGPVAQGQHWVSLADAKSLMARAIKEYGDLPGGLGLEYLSRAIALEAGKSGSGSSVRFNAESRSTDPTTKLPGSYYGLYQIGRAAFNEVASTGKIKGLPLFQVAVYSPWFNTAVALVYAQVLVSQLRKPQTDRKTGITYPPYNGPITLEILYGAHNQGSLGLKAGAKNALANKGQSKAANPVIGLAVSQMRGYA